MGEVWATDTTNERYETARPYRIRAFRPERSLQAARGISCEALQEPESGETGEREDFLARPQLNLCRYGAVAKSTAKRYKRRLVR